MRILFLCKSNVFRSQMAEAFFNKYSSGKDKAESAAIIKPQEKMHKLIIRAMKEKGIDISNNKSKKITKEMIDSSDKIIIMDNALLKYLDITEKDKEKIEIWNIKDIVARENDEHLYTKFLEAREKVEKKVKELIERLVDFSK